jgi:putative FmdB family regulatory protein
MPIYAYKCASCGHAKDVLQKISDAPLSVCPACGAESFTKQLTAAGFQLKGSGWYVTDFRGGSGNSSSSSSDKAGEKSGDKAAEPAKTESKPADSSLGKSDTPSGKSDTPSGKSDAPSGKSDAPSASAGGCGASCACH